MAMCVRPALSAQTAAGPRRLGPGTLAPRLPFTRPLAPAAAAAPQPVVQAADPQSEDVEKLIKSVRRNRDGYCEGVHTAVDPLLGRTLIATEDIEAGQIMAVVPGTLQLVAESSVLPPIDLGNESDEGFNFTVKFALQILLDRANKTRRHWWQRYLRSLPFEAPELPMFWDPQDLEELQLPEVISHAQRRLRCLKEFYATGTAQALPRLDTLGFKYLGQAVALASTRAAPTALGRSGLQPIIDLTSHSFTPNSVVVNTSDGNAQFTAALLATEPIAEGTPITTMYGLFPNTDLLLDYGFVVDDNPFEAVMLNFSAKRLYEAVHSLGLGPAAPQPWQAKALQQLGLHQDGEVSMYIGIRSPVIDPRLVAAMRTLCSASSPTFGSRHVLQLGDLDMPWARDSEAGMLRAVIAMLLEYLELPSTTAEEDRALLASPTFEPRPNQALAIRYRLQLKEAIGEVIEDLSRRLAAL